MLWSAAQRAREDSQDPEEFLQRYRTFMDAVHALELDPLDVDAADNTDASSVQALAARYKWD